MKFKSASFGSPSLSVVSAALETGLSRHFTSVDVAVTECPDLSVIGSSTHGICGATKLIEFGGEPYAHNPDYRGKNINIGELLAACDMPIAGVLGAGMADAAVVDGHCGEMIPNMSTDGSNRSKVAMVDDGECRVRDYPFEVCGPIANLFVSKGERGKVIKFEVRQRISVQISLTQAIRDSLQELVSGHGQIGMGGMFKLCAGNIKSHVMPDYDSISFDYYDTAEEKVIKDFLAFFDHMGPDLLCFCTLWTGDPTGNTLNLRSSGEHTHFYHADEGVQQAGHYHGDVTPDSVHYIGYLNTAESIWRFGDIYEELGIPVG